MSFFITLLENSDASRRAIETLPRVHSMMHKGLTLAEYRAFLRDLYHIVWHFCPIMAAAAARCDERLRDIRYELYERIGEEKGHEEWVLEDIAAIGGDAQGAQGAAPSAPVQAISRARRRLPAPTFIPIIGIIAAPTPKTTGISRYSRRMPRPNPAST